MAPHGAPGPSRREAPGATPGGPLVCPGDGPSGGFSHAPLLPVQLWRILFAFENVLPESALVVLGFRALVGDIERRA